ncbi:MAG: sulfoxide reductase heme-binding subunit YedZ [Proteobacteria bacterium ST_bin11]|nr:MAG: sulfoxide reductase heme-binding subunit YedZ [Proteobacteria bacterium ST_bin11]
MNWKTLNDKSLRCLKTLVFLAALLPVGLLMTAAWQDDLGANPVEKITHNTGYWTLTFLLLSLSATPLRQLSGAVWLVRIRRMLGLFAFFYACLHFLTYLILDQFFDWAAIAEDILKRPYITVGFAAFLMLIPLAVTSTNAMQRRLGGKNWKRLHRLVYLIASGGVVHFAWLVKKDLSQPLLFGAILALVLAVRWFFSVKAARISRSYSSV